jgi:hypothetical protein
MNCKLQCNLILRIINPYYCSSFYGAGIFVVGIARVCGPIVLGNKTYQAIYFNIYLYIAYTSTAKLMTQKLTCTVQIQKLFSVPIIVTTSVIYYGVMIFD